MTILPPPPPRPRHKCPGTGRPWDDVPCRALGTLMECPECGRWWKWEPGPFEHPDVVLHFRPVRWYDIPARRRIAAHETKKMHYRCPNILGDLHWWDCHPNPNRGQP